MGILCLVGWLFGADVATPQDAMKLDGTTEAKLVRSLSALPPDEQGWITFADARMLFSTKGARYAFGETDQDGRRNIGSFAAQLPVRYQLHAGRGAGLFQPQGPPITLGNMRRLGVRSPDLAGA
jgi:hypothetical protein